MPETIFAHANPEKRLFVRLLTRDISLTDAILDLIDNSINAALQPMAAHLKTADDYERFLADTKKAPPVGSGAPNGSSWACLGSVDSWPNVPIMFLW